MDSPPVLPPKFPCWCRAIYSWGGETKKDLGFIEGDLIECLNAGDGQWWTGRLRRDKRAVGMFPSNFVKVLDESFVPVSRGSSPQTSLAANKAVPKQEKSVFRKPFQAYSAVLPEVKKPTPPAPTPMRPISRGHERRQSGSRDIKSRRVHQLRDTLSRQDSNKSYISGASQEQWSYQKASVNSLSNIHHHYQLPEGSSRRQSDARQHSGSHSRQSSLQWQAQHNAYEASYQQQSRRSSYLHQEHSYEQPVGHSGYPSRVPSQNDGPPPPPPQHTSRAPSPDPYETLDEGPPPPPPPHRISYNQEVQQPPRAPSPAMNDRYPALARTPSPVPHSPGGGFTPSPLRDAMDDVLDSLQDMSVDMSSRQDETGSPEQQEPLNPWSPEAFEELRTNSRRKAASRPQTSMDLQGSSKYADDDQYAPDSGYGSQNSADEWKERMEDRLRATGQGPSHPAGSVYSDPQDAQDMILPPTSKRSAAFNARPVSSYGEREPPCALIRNDSENSQHKLRARKSAYELGKDIVSRTFTTKSNGSNATQSTNSRSNTSGISNHTLMSGSSAGAYSATSAGSFARRKFGSIRQQNRPISVAGTRPDELVDTNPLRPVSQMSGYSYHASHPSQNSAARPVSALERPEWAKSVVTSGNPLGGLTETKPTANVPQLKNRRSGFLRKLVDSARAGAANARNTIASGSPEKESKRRSMLTNGSIGISSTMSAAEEMGLGGGVDWMQFRRDVNRSNSLSVIERQERQERCEMMSQPVVPAVDLLAQAAEGGESLDGMPITEPTNFQNINMQLVDKAARFVTNLPPMTNSISLAQAYLCRPYRSDVQRLRAIFTWVSERIAWEEDFDGEVDTRRVIQTRRGCAAETAVLVMELCEAVGLHAEIVNGYLKPPSEIPDVEKVPRPNHWWNAVLIDGEWRMMDCSLASPTNPKRSLYSSSSAQAADSWYFLAMPLQICYTHIPSHIGQQHIVPPVSPDILVALPCACPPFFKHGLNLVDYDTSQLFLSDLEVMQFNISVPPDVELHAEVESRGYARDLDGDMYESGENVVKRALAEPQWVNGSKQYTVKALLPTDERQGKLRVYAGKRGLMHSIKDNPHSLALSMPIVHSGQNPPYDFFIRHPTPHAQRHDLYVAQPQCYKLACDNTFVFAVRQHPSSITSSGAGRMAPSPAFGQSGASGAISPLPFRPGSALSMSSGSASGSNYGPAAGSSAYSSSSGGAGTAKEKPAKLAVQSPSGKILRMSRKASEPEGEYGGGTWEAYIKIGEKGTWRGLVLADRSARWCVFGEWECV